MTNLELAEVDRGSRRAEPLGPAESFYAEALRALKRSRIPFLLGGTYAVNAYVALNRRTKDIDVFCTPGDFPRIIALFQRLGYRTEIEDERWIAKVRKGRWYLDVIFSSAAGAVTVGELWFAESHAARILGVEVRLLPPTELVWSKAFVQDRYKYDGADVAHMILRHSERIDWRRLLSYMDQYWEVLLIHVLNFRFVYPTERERIPRWLLDELLARLTRHIELPTPQTRVCRGRLFSRDDYRIDVAEWGFADIVGGEKERKR